MCQSSSGDYSRKGKVLHYMLNNCLDQIRPPSSEQRMLMRCDVKFDISLQGRNLNTIIGRAAHIEFLETDIFAKFIMTKRRKISVSGSTQQVSGINERVLDLRFANAEIAQRFKEFVTHKKLYSV
ncbi:hypothetical protein L2E82_44993 [Cichorium intybus]|uniref:Uncharacterized protein n=1 Tax=Cichorium intybus TaxID=13427 RepID=A0ACB8ZRC5_CICIN|nr:hypothetical protein L2E82_44993 [Cichorium intybus]